MLNEKGWSLTCSHIAPATPDWEWPVQLYQPHYTGVASDTTELYPSVSWTTVYQEHRMQ